LVYSNSDNTVTTTGQQTITDLQTFLSAQHCRTNSSFSSRDGSGVAMRMHSSNRLLGKIPSTLNS